MPAFLGPLISTGIGALGSLLNNRPREQKSTFKRILTPEQEEAMDLYMGYGKGLLENPEADLAPFKTSALAGVDEAYAGLPDRIIQNFAKRGMRTSGKLLTRLSELDVKRAGALAGVENEFAKMKVNRRDQGAQSMLSLLGMNFGSETTGTQSGNMLGGAFSGGVEGAMFGGTLGRLMNNPSVSPSLPAPDYSRVLGWLQPR